MNVSGRILQQRLQEGELRYWEPLSKLLLTLKHQQDRLQLAKQVENQDWSKAIVTDETTFGLRTLRRLHWKAPSDRTSRRTMKFSLKFSA